MFFKNRKIVLGVALLMAVPVFCAAAEEGASASSSHSGTFYVGGQIGVGTTRMKRTDQILGVNRGVLLDVHKVKKSGLLCGGFYGGYLWTFPAYFMAVEGFADLTPFKSKAQDPNHVFDPNITIKRSATLGVKAKVGMPVGGFLPYGVIGLSASMWKYDSSLRARVGQARRIKNSYKKTKWGPIFGIGCDKVIAPNLRAGLEWNASTCSGLGRDFKLTRNITLTHKTKRILSHQVMVRLSYLFGQ